jgi:hypothetical protein
VVLALLGLTSCAGRQPPVGFPVPVAAPGVPWSLPAEMLGRQFLFRVDVDSSEGDSRLRLTLRLVAADRFALVAADALGRAWWSLEVVGGEALAIDHRQRTYCRSSEDDRLVDPLVGLDQGTAVPLVLLGQLPLPPLAGTAGMAPGEAVAAVVDYPAADGRRVSGVLAADGRPERWTLWQDGEPQLWWAREGSGGRLDVRRDGLSLRWQPVVSEALPADALPAVPTVPSGYRASCAAGED